MLNITIIAIGKLKEQYLRDASAEYQKRLSASCKLNIIELNPEKLSDNPSAKEIENALANEAKSIIAKIPKGAKVYSMCIEGKQLSSEDFSKSVSQMSRQGRGITFIIGSSYGLSERVKEISNVRLSLSKMTFPHQLFRVMLLEQLYRAFKIDQGSTYHK